MKAEHLLAKISRDFLASHGIIRYRKKIIEEMSDPEVISFCHWYSEDEIPDMVSWGTPEELAKEIVTCEYEIEIYDDYRE